MNRKKIACFGGSGYVGSWTIPQLLADGHFIRNFDIQYFGDGFLPRDNTNLENIRGDIRDTYAVQAALEGADTVLMLGCISNDHSCQLDGALSRSVNYYAFEPLVEAARNAGVKRFIYASSSSVYGISHADEVFETDPLIPATLYNKSKMF